MAKESTHPEEDITSEWWVYEDYPVNRARVHIGECPFCSHGKGIHRNKDEGRYMKWHGPYSTRDEAWAVTQRLGRKNTDFCAFCCK